MFVDYIIIGAGISGISAGIEFKKNNKSFIILEKDDRYGGHVITKKIDNCVIDLGFIYGNENYKNILHYMGKYGIQKKDHKITFSTIKNNNIVYNNENKNSIYQTEIERFYKLSTKLKWWWWFITFDSFCSKYNFSENIKNDVFLPALSVLFISKHAFKKPAYIVVEMLHSWVGLSLDDLPYLWTSKEGNISVIDNIIKEYNIDIKLNEEVVNISKYSKNWMVTTNNNVYKCNKIICTCSPLVLTKVLNYTNSLQSLIIKSASKKIHPTYGILHRDKTLTIKNPTQLYNFRYDSTNWILTGILSNQRKCSNINPIYLSISNSKDYLYSTISKSLMVEYFKWNHQTHDIYDMMLNYTISPSYFAEWNGIYFTGGWTSVSIAHDTMFKNGTKVAKRSLYSKIDISMYILSVLLLIIVMYLLIKRK